MRKKERGSLDEKTIIINPTSARKDLKTIWGHRHATDVEENVQHVTADLNEKCHN